MIRVAVKGSDQRLGSGSCRVIAEAGVNHNNSLEQALRLVKAASDAGAWAIKFQIYKAEALSVRRSPKYWQDSIGTRTQYEAFAMSDKLPYDSYGEIANACKKHRIVFFATPFDFRAVELLEEVGAPLYKIASGDITHKPLLEAVAQTGKPIILSTGASTQSEIEAAIGWLGLPPEKLVLLVCTLSYPTEDAEAHFARLETFREQFNPYLAGVSDHTLGASGGWMAGALGAVCIEKHFTLDKSLPDVPDHKISVDPSELAEVVHAAELGALLRGEPSIVVRQSETLARENARRSVVVASPKKAGEMLTREDVDFKRPGTGIPPFQVDDVIGKRLKRPTPADTILDDSMLKS